jgi:hypothetical protein
LLTIQLKNIKFDEYGAVLIVTGKTGTRRIRIIASVPALSIWGPTLYEMRPCLRLRVGVQQKSETKTGLMTELLKDPEVRKLLLKKMMEMSIEVKG